LKIDFDLPLGQWMTGCPLTYIWKGESSRATIVLGGAICVSKVSISRLHGAP
jgi:hypothetical protein